MTNPEGAMLGETKQQLETEGLTRREFIVKSSGSLLLGFVAVNGVGRMGRLEAAVTSTQINSWLEISSDATVRLTVGAADMGQGSFSGLAQILSEELSVDFSKITVIQGPASLAQNPPIGSSQVTAGSGMIRNNYWAFRNAGATAREMLVAAAMNIEANQNRASYTVQKGVITCTPTGKTFTYGQVAAAAALLTPPKNPPLISSANFQLIGKSVPRVDIPSKVDGSAKYGIDIRLPNMLYAVIQHSPVLGGTLNSTPAVPSGMVAIVPTKVVAGLGRGLEAVGNTNAIAVVGHNTWDVWQAAQQLNLSWKSPANAATLNDANFLAEAQALVTHATPYVQGGANGPGTLYSIEGNAAATKTAIAGAAKVVDQQYFLPYVAHACMEVLNCTVDYKKGVSCDIYAPTQWAASILGLAASMTGLDPTKITVIQTNLGGGLGRKLENDFVSQAIQVAIAVGRPVKLMWPREEDFTHDQYRPMALIHGRAGLDANNNIVGWSYRNISPSILAQHGFIPNGVADNQAYEASDGLPYKFSNFVTEWVSHPAPIPVGFWRSVGASINTFGVESLIDELAASAGQDPYTFRLNHLTDDRWKAVLEAAARLGNWTSAPPAGHYRGIAVAALFGSIAAEVVEISQVTTTSLTVNRVSVALDCYIAVNPTAVESQLIGGIVHGMNAALYGRQNFVRGAAQHRNFDNSRMIRLGEMPQVSVTLIPNPAIEDSRAVIGGVGELGVPTFAPALANAYFKATGRRIRSLPFFPNATMGGL